MQPKKEKWIIGLLCVIGIGAVAYGMTQKNHPVFIGGLVIVVLGYLLIRKKLKESFRKIPSGRDSET